MTYLDDETRDMFHRVSTLLQIVVSILEYEVAKFHVQLHLIGAEIDIALLAAEGMRDQDMFAVCDKINQQFKRTDKKLTCVVHDTTLKLFKCFVTNQNELSEVH